MTPALEPYLAARQRTALHEVSFGLRDLRLYGPAELDSAQLGFRDDGEGNDLTGTSEGDWRPEWFVVAHEGVFGDPIFVDTSRPELPIYTAMHGEGDWVPEQIADSFDGFVAALMAVAAVSGGREHPVGLAAHPLSEAERAQTVLRVKVANPNTDLGWWMAWLEEPEVD